jgi:NAD(P)H-dependent FMN reductase
MRVGIMLGSSRPHGNAHGLIAWLLALLSLKFGTEEESVEFVNLYPNASVHPLGPVVDDTISAMVTTGAYADPNVQEWSKLVSSCQGFIVLTPQFNWGYPGDLKNAMDHLYYEWRSKPVMLVTYGGHGGSKCAKQLREVLAGLKMGVVESEVSITLPEVFIKGDARVLPEDFARDCGGTCLLSEQHAFLQVAEVAVQRAGDEFQRLLCVNTGSGACNGDPTTATAAAAV